MLWLPVDRTAEKTLIRQVYEQIRGYILYGELRAGTRLPSTRELAADLHVSRNVILEAYDQLLAEGYIESRPGSGTYVAEGTYLEGNQPTQPFSLPPGKSIADPIRSDIIDFRSGLPALDHFPRKIWGQLTQRVYTEIAPSSFGYDNPEGRLELRSALSRYLLRTRGVRCHPDQIVITSGAAQAFTILAHLLITPGAAVIIEDLTTYEVQLIFSSPGAMLHPIPVDEHGMQTDLLPQGKRSSFVFVTPSHQFPLGGILPIQRRIQLIQFARANDCFIVEDDYDSEFRYTGTPISSLQGLDPEHVIYVGTFSKILSPALRLGYMILPSPLIDLCRRAKRLNDLHSPSLDQLVLARFIDEGHLERHIVKMKRIYRKRRTTLIQSLSTHFAGHVHILGDATGLHLVASFPGLDFTSQAITSMMEQAGVRIYPVELHAIRKGEHRHQLIMGYSNLTCEEITEGVRRMATVIRHLLH